MRLFLKTLHFKVLCTRCVDDSTYQKPPQLSSKWTVLKGNLTKDRSWGHMNFLGTAVEDFEVSCHMRNHPLPPQSSLVNSKTEEILPHVSASPTLVLTQLHLACSFATRAGSRVSRKQKQSQRNGGSINKRWVVPFLRHEEENQIHREWLLLIFRGVLRWIGF